MASFLSVVLVVHQTLNAESVRLLVYALALVCGSLEELFGFAASSRDGSDGGGEHGEVSRLLLLREEKEKVRERFFLAFGRFVCGNCCCCCCCRRRRPSSEGSGNRVGS